MDDHSLLGIITNPHNKSFWIKPFGLPEGNVDLFEVFSSADLTVDFSREPDAVSKGDVVMVYRIHVSKLCFIAEAGDYQKSTSEEIVQTPWRARWPWRMALKNLSPEFGKVWAGENLRPFSLAREYNGCHPQDKQNLGTLQFGNDKIMISDGFGKFIIEKIIALK